MSKIESWKSNGHVYLDVPYAQHEKAKAMGGSWNPNVKLWYVRRGRLVKPFLSNWRLVCRFSKNEPSKANITYLKCMCEEYKPCDNFISGECCPLAITRCNRCKNSIAQMKSSMSAPAITSDIVEDVAEDVAPVVVGQNNTIFGFFKVKAKPAAYVPGDVPPVVAFTEELAKSEVTEVIYEIQDPPPNEDEVDAYIASLNSIKERMATAVQGILGSVCKKSE